MVAVKKPAGRCTGHCCRGFWLPLSHREFEAQKRSVVDGRTIAPMLIEIGPDPSGRGYRFNCKHHLPNGDCGIYAVRPEMCRGFPYDRECTRPECTCLNKGVTEEVWIRWHQKYYFTW